MQIILAILLPIFMVFAFADGKFYSDRIPADIPYQRAIIFYDGNESMENLLLESKFVATDGKRFGWVIPVPSVPQIEAPELPYVEYMYSSLERESKPLDLTFYLALVTVIAWFFYRGYRRIRYGKPQLLWRRLNTIVIIATILIILGPPEYQGVTVLKEERVGPYETKVIQGESAAAIIDWLQANGFAFNEKDRTVFADYIKRKWVFVAAKLDTGIQGSGGKMVPPLSLWFESPYAVYPLALTGTSGHNTEVMLYVRATARMDADERLPLQFVGKDSYYNQIGYITKFRGELTPQQMQSDIIFKPATNNALYRKWEFSYAGIEYILGLFMITAVFMVIALSFYHVIRDTIKAIHARLHRRP